MMEHPPHVSAGLPPHVLVMDDTPAILDLLREILQEDGYRVTASQERLDLPRIRDLHPDLIVTDLLFAGVQEPGEPLWLAARRDAALADVPIVLCTAASREVQGEVMAVQLRRLRVHVVLKPFDIDELLAILAAALTAAPPASIQ